MDTPNLEQDLTDQWRNSVSVCCASLEPDDLQQVLLRNSWEDVHRQILNAQDNISTRQEFIMLKPGLAKLRLFADYYVRQLIPSIDMSVYWGMTRLVIQLMQEETSATSRVSRMLRDLCPKVDMISTYCAEPKGLSHQLKESCIDCCIALLTFFSNIVKFLRKEIVYSRPGDPDDLLWQPVETKYQDTARSIDGSLSRIEKLFTIAERSDRMDESSRKNSGAISLSKHSSQATSQAEEQARLPCVILPSIRTTRFFDRTDVIDKMESFFRCTDHEHAFRSLALYGLGGVGKSSVALRYAEAKLRNGDLDALFWVYSEKLVSMNQSFTDIALRLKLPEAKPGDHEENRKLVLDWLQYTQCRWLIVYDNAEDLGLLRTHWPAGNRGQALITSRSNSFGFELADGGLEVKTWDTETGSRFLLHLLSTDVGAELEKNEATSAHELSKQLSGHALAISHMAGLIHRRAWSVSEFMKIYQQYPSVMHGVSGNSSIDALWEISFKSLDEQSRAFLGVFCYLSPDSITQVLFEPPNVTDLPERLSFCSDYLRLSETIESLLTLALLKRDKISRTFSLHRLVQMSFKHFMTKEERQKSFNDATILVSCAFPRRDSNTAQLYLMWARCAVYVQHVLSLKDCFLEERNSNPAFTAPQTYCDLSNACQRYLLEINSYEDLGSLIEVNRMALAALPKEQQLIGLQGSLTSHSGQLLIRLGKPEEGVEWLRKSYEIRSHDQPFNLRESAWAAENAANGIATLNQLVEAIKWQELARDHWLEWSNTHSKGEWPACIKKSLAMTLIHAGEPTRAREIALLALQQVNTERPYNWAMAAYTHFALGTIDRAAKQLEAAEAHFMEAQNMWLKGDQLRTDPFNAACMYKIGCAALDQGRVEAAVKHLRDASLVTDMRKGSMIAEHARCMFKLSEALEQEIRDQPEAWRLREEAERLLLERNPQARDTGLESTYDSLINILWR